MMSDLQPPGFPGIPPRWTSSAKNGIGTSLGPASRVWFTHSHGILNEVYYSRVDQACIRDFGMIVTDGRSFFSEEKRHTRTTIDYLAPGVPAYRITNRCLQDRYTIEKELFSDPTRDVVLQRIKLVSQAPNDNSLRLFALLAPHLSNHGSDNSVWIGEFKGTPLLFAERNGTALALACSHGWMSRSVGYVGFSDGWQDLSRNKQITWFYERADHGNVALVGEIPATAKDEPVVLALGFGTNSSEAALRAITSLQDDYETLRYQYITDWNQWLDGLLPLGKSCPIEHRDECIDHYRVSAAVIRAHEEKRFPGGVIASLSIPWGFSKGDDDLGGYHLVWPRDLVETTGALIAAGAHDDARRVIQYLRSTQEADGHWAQNMWLDGRPYWSGVQMDETALPVLLVDLAYREEVIDDRELQRLWPMVRRAASYVVRNGPVTQQDRWEEDPGYSPFTVSTEIAALLAAADMEEKLGTAGITQYLRETADTWYSSIDRWMYAGETELAREVGVDGYYVRIAPPETSDACSPVSGFVAIKNRPPEASSEPAVDVVSPDALALVRFGLRAGDDPRIVNTVKVIDHLLRVELPPGPCWYRYNNDGYGEHEDGSPFDGIGIGRAWPLLTGERAHYELAAGNGAEAERLLGTFGCFAGVTGLLPEQVWDRQDLVPLELIRGRPSGSAMPLVWAHAEYIKLLRSLGDGSVFDKPPQTVQRYLRDGQQSPHHVWRFNHKCRLLPAGKTLRVELLEATVVSWMIDGSESWTESPTQDTGLGVHLCDVPTSDLPTGSSVRFTVTGQGTSRTEGTEFLVEVV